MNRLFVSILCCFVLTNVFGQQQLASQRTGLRGGGTGAKSDSLSNRNKEIPKGLKVWTVDENFGDRIVASVDTVSHGFQNSVYTDGMMGEYNFTGNLGSPRMNRIFSLIDTHEDQFIFMQPYGYFNRRPGAFLFTNTLSPLTNLTYLSSGNRLNGEDHFKAKYAVNVNKQLGFGFDVDYLYGRGYYSNQSTSLFGFKLYGSYLGERYEAHLLGTTNSLKIFENGGITDDMYITHPESFDDNYAASELPTRFSQNWNRNRNKHLFFTHRYNIGFNRKVPMTEEEIKARKFAMESEKDNARRKAAEDRQKMGEDVDENPFNEEGLAGRPDNAVVSGDEPAAEKKVGDRVQMDLATADSLRNTEKPVDDEWMKNEYVPVTSFIHTLRLDDYKRIYDAADTPTDYYANEFIDPSVYDDYQIHDVTKHFRLRNTAAMSMLEGFNKWMLAGIKVYALSDLRHFALPDDNGKLVTYNDHNLSIGGQLSKTQGNTLHYNVSAETCLLGDEQTAIKVDGSTDLNFKLFGDTITLAASGFFHRNKPNYYLRHYHGSHFWWDEDLSMTTHTRLQGVFRYQKTRTTLRAAVDELTNYTYVGETYEQPTTTTITNYNLAVRQYGSLLSLYTLALSQDLTFGPLNWETTVTYQKSTNQDALPVPDLNIYTNVYLKFKIAKVLRTELGADMRYFTQYTAPDYAPSIGQYVVQENAEKTKLGNYPFINAYANFCLKGTRFFVMYSRAYSSAGNAFLAPHYPVNPGTLRIGISWDFYN